MMRLRRSARPGAGVPFAVALQVRRAGEELKKQRKGAVTIVVTLVEAFQRFRLTPRDVQHLLLGTSVLARRPYAQRGRRGKSAKARRVA